MINMRIPRDNRIIIPLERNRNNVVAPSLTITHNVTPPSSAPERTPG
jgi:hypothetical protein